MKPLTKLKSASAKLRLPSRKKSVTPGAVTSKTIEQHRDEVIGRARKYIYPLRASKKRIIVVSSSILGAAIIVFLVVCGFLLYKFQNNSTFIYHVIQVVPYPVARADGHFVAYENYLFEVRHYIHYYSYRTQQPTDFNTKSGQDQLDHYKHQALQTVVDFAYVKQLAAQYDVKVSQADVNASLAIAKSRLGNNSREFGSVLQSFWGWSVSDYKRKLKQELLSEKVASKLDTGAHEQANMILGKLDRGEDFATLAGQYSADKSTSGNGGEYHETILSNNTDLPPEVVAEAFKLSPGQHSGVLDTGYNLEIIKLLSSKDNQLKVAHIEIKMAPITKYIEPLKKKNPPTYYISLPKE